LVTAAHVPTSESPGGWNRMWAHFGTEIGPPRDRHMQRISEGGARREWAYLGDKFTITYI
jgi:hypothetical protein